MIIIDTFEGAPCAIAIANPDQNRHLMTVAAHLASQPRRSLSLPAPRAPAEHKSADLVTSEDPLLDRLHVNAKPRTCFRPKRLVFVLAGPHVHDCAPSSCAYADHAGDLPAT